MRSGSTNVISDRVEVENFVENFLKYGRPND